MGDPTLIEGNMKKILFVCAENACRSQMAEAFFNHFAKNAKAESAGTIPAERVNPLAVEVMEEVGIDISGQRPKRIDFQTVNQFDSIISFGCIVKATFPAKDKLEEWHIEDPKGQSISKFQQVRDIIQERVKELIKQQYIQ